MRPLVLVTVLVLSAPALLLAPVHASDPAPAGPEVLQGIRDHLAQEQRDDGTFPFQSRIMQAFSQTGLHPGAWPHADASVAGTLEVPAADDYSSTLWTAHGLASAGYDPRDFKGVDLLERIRDGFDGTQFGAPTSILDDAWAIMALAAAGVPADDSQIRSAASRIDNGQNTDGGWTWSGTPGGPSGADESAWGVLALHAADRLDPGTAEAARGFFTDRMAPDGSYEPMPDAGPNCQSTAWAMHARHLLDMTVQEQSIDFILTCRTDGGGFSVTPGGSSNTWATAEIYPVLAGHLMPWTRFQDDAHAQVPTTTHVGTPTQLTAQGDGETTWTLGDGDGSPMTGAQVEASWDQPGEHAVHVTIRDPASQYRATHWTTVRNDPPAFHDLPAGLTADRVAPFHFDATASDPEGYPVTIDWTLAQGETVLATGQGATDHVFTELGTYHLELNATDPQDATATATIPVTVQNLAPRFTVLTLPTHVAEGETIRFHAEVHDPDGPDPEPVWTFDGETIAGNEVILAPGPHTATVQATDADGTTIRRDLHIDVGAGTEEGPEAVPPRILTFVPERSGDQLHVAVDHTPHEAQASLRVNIDGTQTEQSVARGDTTIPVPREATIGIMLVVRHQGLEARAEAGPFAPTGATEVTEGQAAGAPDAAAVARQEQEPDEPIPTPAVLALLVLLWATAVGRRR